MNHCDELKRLQGQLSCETEINRLLRLSNGNLEARVKSLEHSWYWADTKARVREMELQAARKAIQWLMSNHVEKRRLRFSVFAKAPADIALTLKVATETKIED